MTLSDDQPFNHVNSFIKRGSNYPIRKLTLIDGSEESLIMIRLK
jgi:hypothetical protein